MPPPTVPGMPPDGPPRKPPPKTPGCHPAPGPYQPQPPKPAQPMCSTMQPMTSPTGGRPTPVTAAAPGTSSSDVRTPSAWNRAMRAAAAGGRPFPSQGPSRSVMARTITPVPGSLRGRSAVQFDQLDVQVAEPPIEDDVPRLGKRGVDLRRGVRRRAPGVAGEPDHPDAAGSEQR